MGKIESVRYNFHCLPPYFLHFAICALSNMGTLQHMHFSRQTSWMDQLDRSAGRTYFFFWSLGQFAYSKIDVSVCTLLQLLSLRKALFFRWFLRLKPCNQFLINYVFGGQGGSRWEDTRVWYLGIVKKFKSSLKRVNMWDGNLDQNCCCCAGLNKIHSV